jgi:hypothetical protein
MESYSSNNFVALSTFLNLQENEGIRFAEGGVSFLIKNEDELQVLIRTGMIVLTTQRVIYLSEASKKGVWFSYQNAITHGTNKLNLIIMLSYSSEAQEKLHKEQLEVLTESADGYNENQENDIDYLLNLLDNQNDISSGGSAFLRLLGEYEITMSFSQGPTRVNLEDVFKVFSECSALNPDEVNENDVLEAPFDFDELITANDIDDNGRINLQNGGTNEDIENDNDDEYVDEEDDEGEDYEEGEDGDDQNGDTTNGANHNNKMDLE